MTDSAGVSYQWIGGGTGLVNQMKPLARSFAYDSGLGTYVLIDMQGKTQQSPQSAGWNTAIEEAVPPRYLKLVNRKTGEVLDVNASSMENGAKVQQWWYGSGTNQQWSLVPATENFYQIVNRHSGKVLDVTVSSVENGAIVQQYVYGSGTNQQWSLVPTTENYYKIVNRNSGKVLEVKGGWMDDGVQIQQWQYADVSNENQQWSLEVVS